MVATRSAARAPIVSRTGTYRTATAEQTRARVEPMLSRFGITRVADITRLDEVGLPVHVAYRPCGSTLAVSIGIGLTAEQSWVSAVMESIEVWHAENCTLDVAVRAPARDLALPYDVRTLSGRAESILTERTVLDWVWGRGLLSDEPVLVPLGVVRLDSTERHSWDQVLFDASSNGTATGNTHGEAVLHGLLEVIERDSCAPLLALPLSERVYADPDTAAHPVAATVLAALRAADCWVELCRTTNAIGVPAYACALWSADLPLYFTGFGCHPVAGLAVARAMFEAALSRLATVSGARDDIDESFYANASAIDDPTGVRRALVPVDASVGPDDSIESVVQFCARRVRRVSGCEPIVVTLTREDVGIPATKVIAPGLRMLDDRLMAARPAEAG